MENNPEKKNSPEEETPAQRLRRILSSSQTQKTDVEPLSSQPQEQPKESSDRNAERPEAGVPYEEELSQEPLPEEFRTSDTQPIEIERVERKARASTKVSPAEGFQDAGRNISAFFQRIFSRRAAGTATAGERHGGGGKPPIFNKGGGNASGCLLRGALIALFSLIILGIIGSSIFLIQYFVISSDLPNVDDLRQHASQFQTTSIYDRNGNLIYEILDPSAGRRTYTTLDNISPYLIAATIATEDKDFYTNPGFDPMGIVRALWQNSTSGKVVSGASTITQQLARALLLSPEERNQVTTHRKAREIVLAAEITRRYSKDDILEMYLNEVYYGNLAYGVEAAAETYFGTSADQLNLAQASFLAGLPQAPAVYDIFTNRDATLARQTDVLGLMVQLSEERKCIKVDNSSQPVCVAVNDAVSAAQQTAVYTFVQRGVNMPYPHWVNYIRTQLEARYDPQTIYRSGFKVYTTLDPRLQDYAQASIKNQVAALVNNNATDGALVAIEPSSGQILAMVGSADFNNDAIAGQVNMAVALRQPGSSIKPLTYTAAFEKGWTPATLIWDVPSEFPPSGNADDTRDPYQPVNYDGKFHGPVLARDALANSYNIPAVKTLSYVGIYDDPTTPQKDGFIAFAERMGIDTFTRNDYGLSLTLGGGDVTCWS
jgi:membrane peptidoglycan carboxypeptidase